MHHRLVAAAAVVALGLRQLAEALGEPDLLCLGQPLSAEEQQKFLDAARQRIGEVERLLRDLEGRQMSPPQLDALTASKNFLDQARAALGQRDYQRASNLAGKARALGDDLAATTK